MRYGETVVHQCIAMHFEAEKVRQSKREEEWVQIGNNQRITSSGTGSLVLGKTNTGFFSPSNVTAFLITTALAIEKSKCPKGSIVGQLTHTPR